MTVAASLTFPGPRALAGWWRQLAGWSPRGLVVGHVVLHRLEALARVALPHRLDPCSRLLLRALALPAVRDLAGLQVRTQLAPPVLNRLLDALARDGLVRSEGTRWELTPLGHNAEHAGEFRQQSRERRTFGFVQELVSTTGREGNPLHGAVHFVNLGRGPGASPPGLSCTFDPHVLRECIGRPPDWKERHQFPAEVEHVYGLGPIPAGENGEGPPTWQQVLVDRMEQVIAACALVAPDSNGTTVLGFSARADGWALDASEPLFRLGPAWREALPGLAHEPPLEAWTAAWRNWCLPRNLPPAEYENCRLERREHRLAVLAPRRLIERLRAQRSDALKGEAWLLAGEGAGRTAALIEPFECPSP